MRLGVVSVAAVLALAACTSQGSGQSASPSPGESSSTVGSASAEDVAAAYERAFGGWIVNVENATTNLAKYPDQLNVKHDTAAQLSAQAQDCEGAQSALATLGRLPVLDTVPGNGSIAYRDAVSHAAALAARAKPLRAELQQVVRFCTWVGTLESSEVQANTANAQLFAAPLRYSGTTTIKGVQHTCPSGASCYTPDQSLWPRIVKLWQQQGAATAAGAHLIQKHKVPCLFTGWEKACDVVVSNQLAYETWSNTYAKAFDDGRKLSLGAAAAKISAAGVQFTKDVLAPLAVLPGIYARLAPNQTYNGRTSLTGANIWIAEIKPVVATAVQEIDGLRT
ncbi:MAG: hypothetical protein QOG80_2307 [Pseudonocardiales bacterium]|jgi:hypothetical protein|nr:hypothetical protein [Pseudonocardiales bacterium]